MKALPGMRLNTFRISHFSEKVRWVLDVEQLPYDERRLLPGPHLLVTRRLCNASTVPILEHSGNVVQGSGLILDYLTNALGLSKFTPLADDAARGAELEALADHAFGLGVQRISYFYILEDRKTVIGLWTEGGPAWGRAFYTLTYPLLSREVRKLYDCTPDAVARAKERFRTAMQRFDEELASRPYLGGERPNRADVTVAALLAPLCRPPEHLVAWPELPPPLAEFAAAFQDSRTWQHALSMYRLHRRPS